MWRTATAQTNTLPQEGLRDNTPRLHALIHARVITAPGKVLENASVVLKDGVILSVGESKIPDDARIWDLQGKTIYAGFIDSYSRIGLPKAWQPLPDRPAKNKDGEESEPPPADPATGAAHWNPLVMPERNVANVLDLTKDDLEYARSLGFTSAWVVPGRGIFRGNSALINLSDKSPNLNVLQTNVAEHIALEINESDDAGYPNSLMGCMALIRQTFLDTQWLAESEAAYRKDPSKKERPAANRALSALEAMLTNQQSVVLESGDELDFLRMGKIAAEFKLKPIFLGNGYEYRVIKALQKIQAPLIIPVAYPGTPEIETPEKALDISLAALEHWDLAPGNAAQLAAANIPFAFTTYGLHDVKKDFWNNLRLAVRRGLNKDIALAALTTQPAVLTHSEKSLGTIEPGKIANLTITTGDIFSDDEAEIVSTWVDGRNFDTPAATRLDPRGTWKLTFNQAAPAAVELKITGKTTAPEAKLNDQSLTVTLDRNQLVILGSNKAFGLSGEGIIRLRGLLDNEAANGIAQLADGAEIGWSLAKTAPFIPEPKKSEPSSRDKPEPITNVYPAGEYGRVSAPEQKAVFINDATIWTCGPAGRLEKADMLVENGKISQVGKDLVAPPGAIVIEAAGHHLAPGIVDPHSHTAMSRGVNESSSAVTCEVRVGDVIDATDIAIYHQLAGGVTTISQLHGSANPIGGQNSVIKLRWGGLPEDLQFAGAMPGVKFALGENVKQSNWGDKFVTRYPQTRMGVYQIMRDTFLAARDYEKKLAAGEKSNTPVRRDLRLEAVLEILNNQRIVHIHSYRQDEVLAFIRLAQEFKFTVATFQHILEGYKVADEIAKLPAGASSFADWWGYKFEVYDAIPTNGAIMHEAGVLVSFNSDSNELARRLNVDAAKAVKYGGLSEEEAFKFVTLNPAKQLRLDKQIGSLEVGKDADFVIWSGSPLSTYSYAMQTWIEGRKYFDSEEDKVAQKEVARLRERLIQKALPDRLKALGGGGSGDLDDDKSEPEFNLHDYLTLQHRLHWWTEYRGLYHNGNDRHNCSILAHQWK